MRFLLQICRRSAGPTNCSQLRLWHHSLAIEPHSHQHPPLSSGIGKPCTGNTGEAILPVMLSTRGSPDVQKKASPKFAVVQDRHKRRAVASPVDDLHIPEWVLGELVLAVPQGFSSCNLGPSMRLQTVKGQGGMEQVARATWGL